MSACLPSLDKRTIRYRPITAGNSATDSGADGQLASLSNDSVASLRSLMRASVDLWNGTQERHSRSRRLICNTQQGVRCDCRLGAPESSSASVSGSARRAALHPRAARLTFMVALLNWRTSLEQAPLRSERVLSRGVRLCVPCAMGLWICRCDASAVCPCLLLWNVVASACSLVEPTRRTETRPGLP